MKKIRTYRVTSQNARGQIWRFIVPAHDQAAALTAVYHSERSAVAEYLGQQEITLSYDGNQMVFEVYGERIDSEHPAYIHLYGYCQKEIDQFTAQLEDEGLL